MNVETYLTVMFWLLLIGVVIRACWLVADHPRQQKPVNLGTDVFNLLVQVGFLVWVSILRNG